MLLSLMPYAIGAQSSETNSRDLRGKVAVNSILGRFSIDGNDWNPATNNIRVIVDGNGQTGDIIITFPKAGEAPMMIAVPETKDWMSERNSVPADWFKDWFSTNE